MADHEPEEASASTRRAVARTSGKLLQLLADPYSQGLAQAVARTHEQHAQHGVQNNKQQEGHIAKTETPETTPSLLDPGQLIEQVLSGVQDSLRRAVLSNALHYLRFFSLRVAVGCSLLSGVKSLIRRAARRAPKKVERVVVFVVDVALPTSFFGPVLGITYGVLDILNALNPRDNAGHVTQSDQEGSSDGVTAAANLPAGLIHAALEVAGVAAPDNIPGIPADSPVAGVGAFVGLPVAPPTSDLPSV